MQKPEITAYLKTYCGWSAGVRAVLAKYNLPYTEKDIIQNPAFRWEMETKSGQPLSPCVEINGQMLPDVSGEEVERYLVENKVVEASDAATDVPTNAACANEQHDGAVKLNLYTLYGVSLKRHRIRPCGCLAIRFSRSERFGFLSHNAMRD